MTKRYRQSSVAVVDRLAHKTSRNPLFPVAACGTLLA